MLSSSSFYNTIAHTYEEYCKLSCINDFLEQEINLIEETNPVSILELGIGTGRLARHYIQKHPSVIYTGIDNSELMLKQAHTSGAVLILNDFQTYVQEAADKEIYFDCVTLPYTTIHHLETDKQLELFKNMKRITARIIINCLTKEQEDTLFSSEDSTEIIFPLAEDFNAKTLVHRIHPDIRNETHVVQEGDKREYLVYERKNISNY
jgi:SAM-dependent methyltransferase